MKNLSSCFTTFAFACVAVACAGRAVPPISAAESGYVLSKAEPAPNCRILGPFFGRAAEDDLNATIRHDLTAAGGNYAVVDTVMGDGGWYSGRAFKCPVELGPTKPGEMCDLNCGGDHT